MSLNILCIESSTDYGSVAISSDDKILDREIAVPRQHSVYMLPLVEELLAESGLRKCDLHAISFGRGPGSFTGIRFAISLAQAMGYALEIPLIPVSSLRVLAQRAWREHQCSQVLAALDARLRQVYWGCYEHDPQTNLMRVRGEERLEDPCQVEWPAELSHEWLGIGSGWDHYQDFLKGQWTAGGYPKAFDMATIARYEYQQGHLGSVLEASPSYLRNHIAQAMV